MPRLEFSRCPKSLPPGPGGQATQPRERGSVRVVPLVGTIETIGAFEILPHTPSRWESPGKRLVYHVLTADMPHEKAGTTSRAISSSSRMICGCGMPGKKVRQMR